MAVFKANKVMKSLKKKGFVESNSDHKRFELFYQGKLVLSTKTSHNNQDIGDALIKSMSHQCKLSKTDFFNLINCPLSKEEYIKKLKEYMVIDVSLPDNNETEPESGTGTDGRRRVDGNGAGAQVEVVMRRVRKSVSEKVSKTSKKK